jgi:hypothetical protein
MIQQMLVRYLRRYAMRYAKKTAMKGVGKAFSAGNDAWRKRKDAKSRDVIEQDPAITETRKRMPDERRGDEILYPTDEYTHSMQPRK